MTFKEWLAKTTNPAAMELNGVLKKIEMAQERHKRQREIHDEKIQVLDKQRAAVEGALFMIYEKWKEVAAYKELDLTNEDFQALSRGFE